MTSRLRLRLFERTVAAIVLAGLVSGAAAGANPFARNPDREAVVLNVAHAGASSVAPQNTLLAGQIALDLGADVWGVDVRRTLDGIFILMHDATLERTTNVEALFPDREPWRVDAFTFGEMRTLDAGSWFIEEDPFGEIATGNVSDEALAWYAGALVPTLREVLEFAVTNDWLLDIEIKEPGAEDHKEIAIALADLIEETEASEYILVSSFDHDFLRVVRTVAPAIPIGALSLFPPLGGVEEIIEVDADVYLPSLVGWTPSLVGGIAAHGIGVIPWTYNDPTQLASLATTPGITGIYTDYPQRLEPLLRDLVREGAE